MVFFHNKLVLILVLLARTTETLPGTMLSVLLSMVEGDKAATEIAKEAGRLMPVHSNIIHMVLVLRL